MLPTRYGGSQTSSKRKSRLEGKPSMLPILRRPGSIDRLSTDNPRPSTTGRRSNSAEPSRGTFGAGRLSREASATKLSVNNGRSRSQTSEARYGQSLAAATPLRSSQYPRPTVTPLRTPTDDRSSRSWQACLDRALAFVTVKDQRPISNVAWQRAEHARVSAALAARGGLPLLRPLTIARFVEVAGALLAALTGDARLNNDNYVTKLPHAARRLLYPGAMGKSWLRSVNTLHAFPHALALLAYLLDVLAYMETPMNEENLYICKDEVSCLRREYLYNCWISFQNPEPNFDVLKDEYLLKLKALLGDDEEKIANLQQNIRCVQEKLEDEAEAAARADEARRRERRDALVAALRGVRAARRQARARLHDQAAARDDLAHQLRAVDADVERASAELERLRRTVRQQPLSLEERTRLLEQVDFQVRVNDSKRALLDKIAKGVVSKDTELALWQKLTLERCVEYEQALIHLAPRLPDAAALAVHQKEVMEAQCAASVSRAVEALRAEAARVAARRADAERERTALARQRAHALEEARSKISELKSSIAREQRALEAEEAREAGEADAWAAEELALGGRLDELRGQREQLARTEADNAFWERQDESWRVKLSAMREYVAGRRDECARLLDAARARRARLVRDTVRAWADKIA